MAVTIITTIVAMFWLNSLLTAIVLLSVSAAVFMTGVVSKKSQQYFAENQKVLGEINSKTEELYTGNSIIKVFNYQQKAINSVMETNEKQYKAVKKAEFFNSALRLKNNNLND